MTNKEIVNKLKPFKVEMERAYKSRYCICMPQDKQMKLVGIYEGITNKKRNHCYHCSSALLSLLVDCYNLYQNAKKDGE